jgi:hypothetical protein
MHKCFLLTKFLLVNFKKKQCRNTRLQRGERFAQIHNYYN